MITPCVACEPSLGRISFLLSIGIDGQEKGTSVGQHAGDGQHWVQALQHDSVQQDLAETRVQGDVQQMQT